MGAKKQAKTSWAAVALGTLALTLGVIMILQGMQAMETGAIIPATTKSGPMTGLQSIITGFLAAVAGMAFLGYEVLKKCKNKKGAPGHKQGHD